MAGAVGEPGDGHGEDGGGDVDGYGQELGGGRCVAEFADDGGEEKGGAVEGADNSPVHWIKVTRQLLVAGSCIRILYEVQGAGTGQEKERDFNVLHRPR